MYQFITFWGVALNEKWQTNMTLLRRLGQQYDEQAWLEFVSYYSSYIRMVLNRLGVDAGDLDDLLQEVLIKTWKSLPSYQKRTDIKFRSWFSSVIRSCAFSWHKKKKKMETVSIDQENSFELPMESDLETIIEAEWKKYISGMAWENTKEQFSAIALETFELAMQGKSNIQIANELGLKDNTVAVYKKRVRQALHHEIARLDYELNS